VGIRRDSAGRVTVRSAAVVDFWSAFMLYCGTESISHVSSSTCNLDVLYIVAVVVALRSCFGTKRRLGTSFTLTSWKEASAWSLSHQDTVLLSTTANMVSSIVPPKVSFLEVYSNVMY
jgi:hypothetical protein